MLNYKEELEKAMLLLADKEDTFFLGQSLEYGGIAMAQTFQKISNHKKLEMPVAENLQMGISTGLALEGFVPITVFPRWNFLLVAADQLVNHLDKIILMTEGQYRPRKILKTIEIVKLTSADQIVPAYLRAYNRTDGISTILVEEHQF